MYRRRFAVLCLLAAVSLLASSVSVFAMPPGPDFPPPPPKPPARPFQPFVPDSGDSQALGDGAVTAQTIALGKPGTAYRFAASFGQSGSAYVDDNNYLNGPFGLVTVSDGRVYVMEQDGARLFSYDTDTNLTPTLAWRKGTAGLHDRQVTGLAYPNEAALGPDNTLWVADRDTLSKFNAATGALIATYQDPEVTFSQLRGVVFDGDGNLFVSDYDRHVIDIFTLNDEGDPEFYSQLGLEDTAGSDEIHFNNPTQLVVDSENTLYVADSGNNRVQSCVPDGDSWTCTTFHGGARGSGPDQLDGVYGLGNGGKVLVHLPGNETEELEAVYIADTKNDRVKICGIDKETKEAVCDEENFITNLSCPVDAALRPNTTSLLISEWCANAVDIYNTTTHAKVGTFKGQADGDPYPLDTDHLNGPRGIKVDKTGNIFVLEELGKRVLKLDKNGIVLWSTPILTASKTDPLNPSLPHNLSLDSAGNPLVSGPGPHVWLFNGLTGAPVKDLVTDWTEMPTFAGGAAQDASGNLYVSDVWGQRVLKFNKLNQLVGEIGAGVCTQGNEGFCWPQGLAVDKQSNLYVADAGNCRVQKFDKLGNYKLTFSTQKCGDELDSLSAPVDVAVDSKGNLLVTDVWNNRVQVYGSTGTYLTTIGGGWDSTPGRLRNPAGVAVDSKGLVYVADEQGHRLVKYTPGVPYAAPVSLNGFGKKANYKIGALTPFRSMLYAGTFRSGSYGAQIFRRTKTGWEAVMNDAFEEEGNTGINTLVEYKGFLYAGTENCFDDECYDSNGAEIYRSPDGLTWQPVMRGGFGDTGNADVFRIANLGSQVCAATFSPYHGGEIFCSASGDPGSWVRAAEDGLDNPTNEAFTALASFNGAVYAATLNQTDGAEIYRKVGLEEWEQVGSGGLGNAAYNAASALSVYKGSLYLVLKNLERKQLALYRCKTCDGSDWELAYEMNAGPELNAGQAALEATSSALYLVVGDQLNGLEVWKSADGKVWKAVSTGGFDGGEQRSPYWDNSVAVLQNILYVGTTNYANGGSVWKVCLGASCK